MTILFASLPPDVNTISSGSAPIKFPTLILDSFSFFSALSPKPCAEDGLAKKFSIQSTIASTTSLDGFVVALLSKYTIYIFLSILLKTNIIRSAYAHQYNYTMIYIKNVSKNYSLI